MMETEGDRASVESFVKGDPYVKSGIVEKFAIKEFDAATIEMKRRFERMATDFSFRS